MSDLFPVVQVPLVGTKQWNEAYDPAGEMGDRVSQLAWEGYRSLDTDDFVSYVEGILYEEKKKRIRLTEEETVHVVHALKTFDPRLENTRNLILSAGQFAWEKALTPHPADIGEALRKAKYQLLEDLSFRDNFLDDPNLSDALRALRISASTALATLLEGVSHVEYAPHMGGEHLIFDFGSTDFVKALKRSKFLRGRVQGIPTLHWMPPREEKDSLIESLGDLFKKIVEEITSRFWDKLYQDMGNISADNRVNFKKPWLEILEDKEQVKAARKEIREFIGVD